MFRGLKTVSISVVYNLVYTVNQLDRPFGQRLVGSFGEGLIYFPRSMEISNFDNFILCYMLFNYGSTITTFERAFVQLRGEGAPGLNDRIGVIPKFSLEYAVGLMSLLMSQDKTSNGKFQNDRSSVASEITTDLTPSVGGMNSGLKARHYSTSRGRVTHLNMVESVIKFFESLKDYTEYSEWRKKMGKQT